MLLGDQAASKTARWGLTPHDVGGESRVVRKTEQSCSQFWTLVSRLNRSASVPDAPRSSKPRDKVRFLGGVLEKSRVESKACLYGSRLSDLDSICPRGVMDARDSAKVADQVRFLAGTPFLSAVAACNAGLHELDTHRIHQTDHLSPRTPAVARFGRAGVATAVAVSDSDWARFRTACSRSVARV